MDQNLDQIIQQMRVLHQDDLFAWQIFIGTVITLVGWLMGLSFSQRKFVTSAKLDKEKEEIDKKIVNVQLDLQKHDPCPQLQRLKYEFEHQFGSEFKDGQIIKWMQSMSENIEKLQKVVLEIKTAISGDLDKPGLRAELENLKQRVQKIEP